MKWPDNDGFTFGVFFCLFIIIMSVTVTICTVHQDNAYSKMTPEQIMEVRKATRSCYR